MECKKLIFIILLKSFVNILTYVCPYQKSDSPYDCFKQAVNGTFCCYITPLEGSSTDSYCYSLKIEDYLGNLNINHNSLVYEIDCGLGSTFMDTDWNMTLEDRQICGSENPNNEIDCFKGSMKDNSCCYYEGHGLKGCYWLGIKYDGMISKDGYNFKCKAKYLSESTFIILLLVILINLI